MRLPEALLSLLETPLTEELYHDWAQLLSSLLPTYEPPSKHLILCFTLLVHPTGHSDTALRTSCLHILLQTLKLHGSRLFREVLVFNLHELGRNGRRKRRSSPDTEVIPDDLGDITDLVSTESVFALFENLWQCLNCCLWRRDTVARAWQSFATILLKIITQDWQKCQDLRGDLSKTLLARQLKGPNNEIDARRIAQVLLVSNRDASSDLPWPNTTSKLHGMQEIEYLNEKAYSSIGGILDLLYSATQSALPKFEEEYLVSATASVISGLSLADLARYYDNIMSRYFRLMLSDALLYRLAKFAGSSGRAGSMLIDIDKVLTWLRAQPLTNDLAAALKVDFLKIQMLLDFDQPHEREVFMAAATALSKDVLGTLTATENRPKSRGNTELPEKCQQIVTEARQTLEYLMVGHASSTM